jgi:hypothetical protein
VATPGGSVRVVVDWLFVVSVATLVLGLFIVMAELMPPADSHDFQIPQMRRTGSRDTTAVVRPTDHIGAGSDRRTHVLGARSLLHAPSRPSRPVALPPVYDADQESNQRNDVDPRTDLLDSASVAHGYLVPRPSTGKVY